MVSEDMPAAEFAALLRQLKERSGLSYGVLAKRLHMSTSTLHRYCNGDAVPTDYAPVERLARLCKAGPGELVELHRRWVLADAVRGKKGTPVTGGAAPVTPSASVGEPAGPGEPATDTVRRAQDPDSRPVAGRPTAARPTSGPAVRPTGGPADRPAGLEADTREAGAEAREAETPVERIPAAEPSTVRVPAADTPTPELPAAQPPARTPAARTPAARAPQPEAPDVTRPGGVRTRPRRTRTRTAVLAGIAVAAVVGGVALALGLPGGDDGSGGDRKGPAAATVPGAAGAGRTGGAAASPSASASASVSASASTSASPSAKAEESPRTPARASTAPAGEGAGAAVPLTVRTEPYAWQDPCSQRYLINRPASEVKPPPEESDATAWVSSFGAVSSEEQYLRLTVQGTGDETVVVEGLSVRVAGKRSPLAWNDFAMGYPGVGCGGTVPTRSFTVALDAARPVVTPESGQRDFPFSVSESDPEVYYVTADASAYDVSWYLELKWSSGSRSGTLTVDDKGRPFRTSGNNGRPAYEFPLGGEEWVPEGTTAAGGQAG
ncbi:helix-turn-helix domain-containing protein [Streptomyces sp. enrichment culture]|uniref:helix-turn-helix domain-containing protein n=1 Tax=Streptomyces sp. enrichment culture TaxID=1795815 RepID=UPI003F563593